MSKEHGHGGARSEPTPVAIVGIGCRFPGGAVDPEGFWRLLSNGTDAITEIPSDRMAIDHYFDPRPATPGRIMTRWGGFLDRIKEFDAAFFGISPREAERIDPQQRLVLETAWEALEDAGQDIHALEGSSTGVFVGQWTGDFESRLFANPEFVDFYVTNGSGRYSTSGRLSYALGLRGASMTVDTACSSSLVTIHLAVRSIRNGESTIALAGGVNVILQPQITIAYSQSRMMASDGRCKFGDASGDGYVRSEGAGMVVLKSLAQALADGDRIYAVIRGSAVNSDGRSSGSMGTPSRIGQEELLRRAFADSGLAPGQVGYVEAHGTGTRAGDVVELGALGAVLREGRNGHQPAYVGSVKTNIGHTEAAAGVAGLIKLALSLHHRQIPKSLHCKELNPAIPWSDLPLQLAREAVAWPEPESGPRVGGVNSFGVSGTNAHIVLVEAPTPNAPAVTAAPPANLLLLSAKSPEALRALAGRYHDLLVKDSGLSVQDVCWSAATRRTALDRRAGFVAAGREDLLENLRAYSEGGGVAVEGHAQSGRPRIAFVCPGHGAQWVGMARVLFSSEPIFRSAVEECDAAAGRYVAWSMVEQIHLEREASNFLMDRVDVVQPVLLGLTIAYARLMSSLGIVPDAIIGHSMGEAAAAYLAGVIDLDNAFRITCRRSLFMHRTSGRGAMALIDLPMEKVEARLAEHGIDDRVTIGVVNSPRSCVVSGDPQAIKDFIAALEGESVFCRMVKVDVASHSSQMNPVVESLVPELADMEPRAAAIPIYSTLLARRAEGHEFDATYWGRNIRDTVRLGPAIASMLADGFTLFVEMGPHPVVSPSIEQTATALRQSVTTIAVARRDEPERMAWLRAAGALWCHGCPVNVESLLPSGRQPVRLPSYPWQRERHWIREAEAVDARRPGQPRVALTDDQQAWLHLLRWVESAAPPPPLTAGQRSGRVLLVAGATAEQAAYGDAFAREHAAVQVVASVDKAVEILRGAARSEVTAVVWLASDADELPHAALALAQSLADGDAAVRRPRLTIVTCGAQTVEERPRSRVSVRQASVWGLGRVIAEEHPEIWGGLFDLDPDADAATGAAQLAAEACRGGGETQIALRDGKRFVLRLHALDAEPTESMAPWPADGAWLVTGGLGDVGLHLAAGMVAQGVRRLVLLGRSALPPRTQWHTTSPDGRDGRRIAAVRALEAAGAAVHLLAADVADAADLERALRSYEDEAWPPIRGVLHSAGVLETALATRTDRQSLQRVLAPKLYGAENLDRLLPHVDRFVMVSSNSATLGTPGMASYAAANAGLDALAHDRRARGLHGLSIQSGAWIETGMHSGASAEQKMQQLNDMGIQGYTPVQGVAVFNALAGRPEAAITVMPIDWSVFAASRRGRDLKLYEGRVTVDASAATAGFAERLAVASVAERRQLMEPVVREAVGRVLKLAPARVDPRKALGSMGLNSLMAMELRNRLESALGRPLSATLAWNYPTVEALVTFLCGETPVSIASLTPVAAAVTVDAVANLSDADAARLLRRKH